MSAGFLDWQDRHVSNARSYLRQLAIDEAGGPVGRDLDSNVFCLGGTAVSGD